MSTLFGGRPCVDPKTHYRESLTRGLPVQSWWGKANGFETAVGRGPGRGKILMRLGDLIRLDLGADHSLIFSGTDRVHRRELRTITLIVAECTSPGGEADPNAVFLCDVADRRYHLDRVTIDRAYNVWDAGGTTYLEQTLDGGGTWTWQAIVDDICLLLGLDTAEFVLPFSPLGTPENLTFWGGSAWGALCAVLDRLACAAVLDHEADTFSVVRLGATDGGKLAGVENALYGVRTWDGYPLDPERAWRPEFADVRFLWRPPPSDGSSPWYTIQVNVSGDSSIANTSVQLDDDNAALSDGSATPTNHVDLQARAEERAADWLRKRSAFERRLLKVYSDFQPTVLSRALGSKAGKAALDDRGGPMRTELRAAPDGLLEGWAPLAGRPVPPQSSCGDCAPGPILQSGSGGYDSDPQYQPDYFDPFVVTDISPCINGSQVITRCRIEIVYDRTSGRYRNHLYDCETFEQCCVECGSGGFSGSGDDDAADCCTGEILATIGFSAVGPFGSACEICTVAGDLHRAPPEFVWGGGEYDVCGAETAIMDFSVYCQEGVWYAHGSAGTTTNHWPFTIPLTDDGDFLTGEIEVPHCPGQTISLVVDRPCDAPAGGAPCQDNPGGSIDTATVSNKTGDCTCFPDTLTYDGPVLGSISTWSYAGCPGNATIDLFCVNGQYVVYFGGQQGTILSFTASPFTLVVRSPDLGVNCGTSGTVDVTITVT